MNTPPVSSFRRLVAGIDTVQVAYYLRPLRNAAFSFGNLLVAKEKLRASKGRRETPVEIGGRFFVLRPYGSKSGYPLVVESPAYKVECGEFNTPAFFVTFTSQALWHQGAEALHKEFVDWAQAVGLAVVAPERLSRVDFAFDYWLQYMDFHPDSVVSLSAKDGQYREHQAIQTMMYGKGDIVLRIYDKVTEIAQQSEKLWLFPIWGVKENVWRIEWQVRKGVLKRFGIQTFSDLLDSQGDVLRYLATTHDTLRIATNDSNRSRWPMHPLWVDLIDYIQTFQCQGVWRELDADAAFNERLTRIAISVYGYLKRVAAITGIRRKEEWVSLPAAFEELRSAVNRIHDPTTWELDVQAKRSESRLEKRR